MAMTDIPYETILQQSGRWYDVEREGKPHQKLLGKTYKNNIRFALGTSLNCGDILTNSDGVCYRVIESHITYVNGTPRRVTAKVQVLTEHTFSSSLKKEKYLPENSNKIFVVHGRNMKIRDAIFAFLRAIGLDPIEWDEAKGLTGSATPYIGEILHAAFTEATAIIVLFSPDDEGKLRDEFISSEDEYYEKELTPQARPNVIFEAGMALGYNPDKTVFVEIGKLRPFSDIYGRHTIRLDNSPQKKMSLINTLKKINVGVNIDGKTDYLNIEFPSAK